MRARKIALSVLVAFFFTACGDSEVGQGIGRPQYTPLHWPERKPLAIALVYFSDPEPSQRFALLTNAGSEDAADLKLTSRVGSIPLTSAIAAMGELVVPLDTLAGVGLFGGELAVVDTQGTVHAYLAWGSDPALTGSPLLPDALLSGATQQGSFVPTGAWIETSSAIAAINGVVGCAAPVRSTAEITAIAACAPTGAASLALERLTPGSGQANVTLVNSGTNTIDLLGVRVCHDRFCGVTTHDVLLAAGERVTLDVGPSGAGELAVLSTNVLPSEGELAVIAAGEVTITASSILAYARYGAGPLALLDLAVTAGVWPSAEISALAPRVPGEMLALSTDHAVGDAPYFPAAATDVVPLATFGASNDLWTSCSYPRPWRVSTRPTLAVTTIARATSNTETGVVPDRIVLTNRGDDATSLADYELVLTNAGVASTLALSTVTSDTLAAGATLVIELSATEAASCTASYCWGGPVLGDDGEVVVRQGTTLTQYVAFGAASARLYAVEAIAANVWPGAVGTYDGVDCNIDCSLGSLGSSATLELGLDGTSPPDWVVSVL